MGLLIDDLLSLSRVTRSKMAVEEVDVSAIAEATMAELRQGSPGREASVEIAPKLTAHADPRLVRILLDNLLGNAFKFTSKRESAKIEVGTTVDAGQRAFFVRDNGDGFDPRYADKMFGAFQRLHDARQFPGNGVGLATAQRVVKRHGGKIWATGKPDHGATFFFTLPDDANGGADPAPTVVTPT
jgi:light-regulated signal transduction histidine kinase (bacteriophytochrome)